MAMAQEETIPAEVVPVTVVDAGVGLIDVALVLLIGAGVIGVLVVAYVAVTGLKDSYPPGTAESWDKLWQAINDKAGQSATGLDDMAVMIATPIAEAIIEAIKAREGVELIEPTLHESGENGEVLNKL